MTKRTSIPTYETRHILVKIVLDPETKKKRAQVLHPAYYENEIEQIPVGSEGWMTLTTKKPKRSAAQNRYMHLYFSLCAMSHGHGVTTDDVKSWAKGKCLASGITEVYGDKTRKVKDTSKLTIGEMIEFLARVECESEIPLPDAAPFNLGISHEEFRQLRDAERARYMAMKPKEISPPSR